jgi:hypothetical protein
MREHLAFLRRYKDVLRLKLNSAEDLLVNGQRPPTDRGVCRHLLGKLDRTVIEHALEREPLRSDAAARARMLGGALRVTADVGVLLAYLEALAQARSHVEAAGAFAEAVGRIDFASLSPTRLARLLQVLLDTFSGPERVQVVLGLLAAPTFAHAFDAVVSTLPPPLADALAPLRALHARVFENAGADETLLTRGMAAVLDAPDPTLRSLPEPLRVGLLELATGSRTPPALAERAVGVLLPSLPRGQRAHARLALRAAARFLARHADDRARAALEELARAQPGHRTAERWLAALGARRVGRFALGGGEPSARGRLLSAFWLDGQRSVWLRTASAPDAARLAGEADIQTALAIPGVAPVVEHGVASGIPYVAVVAPGRPLEVPAGIDLAIAAARTLHAVALAGVRLPDAEPQRFLCDRATLLLADLDGARRTDPADAAAQHASLAADLVRRLVPDAPTASDTPTLVAALERAALTAGRD